MSLAKVKRVKFNIHSEDTVSQIFFYKGPSLYFMKSRKIIKIFPFFDIKQN